MALIDTEGFGWSTNVGDYLALAGCTIYNGNLSDFAIQSNGPLGDNWLSINNYIRTFHRPFPAALASFTFGGRFNWFGGNDPGQGISFNGAGGNVLFSASHNPVNQALEIWNDSSVMLGATPPMTCPRDGWCFVEIKAAIGSAGSVEVRINGASLLTVSNVDTQAGHEPAASAVRFGYMRNGPTVTMGVAHCYLCDSTGPAPWNGFLGDVRVQTLLPVADDVVQFAPMGSAHNWQNAAHVPPSPATNWNADANAGDQDTFSCAPLAAGLGTIFGVNVKAVLSKSDAGNRTMATVLKSGAAVTVGPATAVSTSPQQVRTVSQIDPATGAAWTPAGVSAARPGYRVVA